MFCPYLGDMKSRHFALLGWGCVFSILEAVSCFSPLKPALRWLVGKRCFPGVPRNSILFNWCLPMITKQVGGFLDSEGPRSSPGRGSKSIHSHSGDALQQQEGFQVWCLAVCSFCSMAGGRKHWGWNIPAQRIWIKTIFPWAWRPRGDIKYSSFW